LDDAPLAEKERYVLIPVAIGATIGAMAVAVTIATRPAAFRISRSAVLTAPIDRLFEHVEDFHHWAAWSPFAKLDPDMTTTFEGATKGVGARYGWSGNSKAGQGKMAITDSVPGQRIAIDLSFDKPMKAENKTVFTFEQTAGGTRVTWTMTGNNSFMGKAFALVVDVDKLLGSSFDEGLQSLGAVAAKR
jgi:uncharacterized protein YndB with AHSA1/START domain